MITADPLTIFGGYKEVARPDPIPNSAVKRFIADGSDCIAFARVGCRQFLLNRVRLGSVSFFNEIKKFSGIK
tara:strand:+ start:406 stop:621 length:216 start_codon:yes stop_codon:yes gene_type:complete